MLCGVHISAYSIIDFRYIAILLAALYGGFIPTMIASAIIGVFRLVYWGISIASINALVVAILVGVGFCIGFKCLNRTSKNIKLLYAILYMMTIITVSSFLVFDNNDLILKTMMVLLVSYSLVSFFIMKYADYLIETIQIYQKLKKDVTKDYLTGLCNVREFDNSFNKISQMTVRKEEDLSLLFIDIGYL